MFSLLKIIQNRYVSVILILILCYVLSHTTFHFLSNVNFAIIIYMLIISKISEETYLPYSIIFGLYSDYSAGSYIGLNVLFFLFMSLIKMFTEYKFDLKTSFSLIIFSIFAILSYNIFFSIILGYNIILSSIYILKISIIDFIIYLIIYYLMEFRSAFRSIKR